MSESTSPAAASTTLIPPQWALQQLQAQWPDLKVEGILPSTYSGKVHFRAVHPSIGRVGVRFFTVRPDDGAADQRLKKAFLHAQQLSQQQHPGAVRLLQVGSLSGCLVIVSQWIEGVGLRDRLNKQPPQLEDGLLMIDGLAVTLESLHQSGFYHGNFRLDSVLIAGGNQPVLKGYGFTDYLSGYAPGPLDEERVYLAPERQGDGAGESDMVSDVYSLGVTAYEILTTKLPVGQFMVAPSQHTGAGKWLDDVIYRAIHPKAGSRIPTAEEFRQALAARTLKIMDLSEIEEKAEERSDPRERPTDASGAVTSFRKFYYIFMLIFLLVLTGAVYIGRQFYQDQQAMKLSAQSMAILMAQALAAHADGDLDLASEIARRLGQQNPDELVATLKSEVTRLMAEGKFEEALELIDMMVKATAGKEGEAYEKLRELALEMKAQWEAYMQVMTKADEALNLEDPEAEYEALIEALKLNPNDLELKRRLAKNPLHFNKVLRQVEASLREWNPDQDHWHITHRRTVQGLELDLSGHANLRDIRPVAALPVDRLDLRHTSVLDLAPLAEMDLLALWLDGTPVQSLVPLTEKPLFHLSVIDTDVADFSVLAGLPNLATQRVPEGPDLKSIYVSPAPGQEWENSLGMRFLPVPVSKALFGTREIREIDFVAFLRDKQKASGDLPAGDVDAFAKAATLMPMIVNERLAVQYAEWLTRREQTLGVITSEMVYQLPWPDESKQLYSYVAARAKEIDATVAPRTRPSAQGPCLRGFFDVLDNAEEWEQSRTLQRRRTKDEVLPKKGFRLVLTLP